MAEAGAAVEQWEVGDDPTVSPDAEVVPTAPEANERRAIHRERWARWSFAGLLTVFLLLSAVGVFGVRSATTSASGDGYELRVTYGRITRPGLASPFRIEVMRRDGSPIDEPVRLAVSSRYMAMFDENGLSPAPSSETSSDAELIWEFDPPETSATLKVTYDGRIEPGVQWGRDGHVQLLDDAGEPLVEVRFRTWVTP